MNDQERKTLLEQQAELRAATREAGQVLADAAGRAAAHVRGLGMVLRRAMKRGEQR